MEGRTHGREGLVRQVGGWKHRGNAGRDVEVSRGRNWRREREGRRKEAALEGGREKKGEGKHEIDRMSKRKL